MLFLKYLVLICSWCHIFKLQHAAHIFGIFPVHSRSHFFFHEAIMRSLLAANHRVTLFAPYSTDLPHQNLTIINSKVEGSQHEKSLSSVARANISAFAYSQNALNLFEEDCNNSLKSQEIKAIKNYDLLFVEMLPMYRCYLHFAKLQNVPVIGTVPFHSLMDSDNSIGNPRMLSNHPAETYRRTAKMNFFDRIFNIIDTAKVKAIRLIGDAKLIAIIEKFPGYTFHLPDPKISLVFINNHESIYPRAVMPNFINIGGIAVKCATLKPVPESLKIFLDEAKHGVILFSTGTQVRSDLFDTNVITVLKNVFAKIPQRVLWKSATHIEGLSNNVLIRNWIPQKEVLAHKNTVTFISHSGLSSTYESIYFGKPMILIPIITDQRSNAALVESLGVGIYLNILELTEEKLLEAINEVINGTKYSKNMEDLSRRFKDDFMSPSKLVVYWTEYVLQHRGAYHLRSDGADLPLYQYLMFDVIGFLILVSIIIGILVYFCWRQICGILVDRPVNSV